MNFVYACALRRVGGDAHLAEDVTQQVFTAVADEALKLSRRPVLAGWLYTTTRFTAAQWVRTEQRRRKREQEACIMNEILSENGASPTDWEKLRLLLDDTLDEMRERDREAVLLRFFEHYSFPALGAKLGIPENAARMRVERALEKMSQGLRKRKITSTGTALGLALAQQGTVAAPGSLAAAVTASALAGATTASGVSGGATLVAAGKIWASAFVVATVVTVAFTVSLKTSRQQRQENAAPSVATSRIAGGILASDVPEPVEAIRPTLDSEREVATSVSGPSPMAANAASIGDGARRLRPADAIALAFRGYDELSTSQTLGAAGEIRLRFFPEPIVLAGRTLAEAEHFLEALFRERRLLKNPVVKVTLLDSPPRFISVLGAVRRPGPIAIPPGVENFDLAEVLLKAGGFTAAAKSDSVSITHASIDGKTTVRQVNVEELISSRLELAVAPGDRVYVPERIF